MNPDPPDVAGLSDPHPVTRTEHTRANASRDWRMDLGIKAFKMPK